MTGSKARLLSHFEKVGTITSMEAFKQYGITRLSARIKELRDKGYNIRTVMMEGRTRYDEPCRYAKYVYEGESNGNKDTGN